MTLRARLQNLCIDLRRKRRTYRTLNYITLHRARVLDNFARIQRQHPHMRIMPVLKANAYGHGLKEMAQILNEADCDLLAVDGYFEAGKVRFTTKHKLLVLGYILPENIPVLDTKRCSFVVQDLQVLHAFGSLNRPVRIHVEINTGMNRLGIALSDIPAYLEALRRYPKLELEGVMTHLADADNEADDTYTARQVADFDACMQIIVAAGCTPRYVHVAQTAGSTKAKSAYANAIRLGIGLYGINPLAKNDPQYHELQDLKPVLTLTSTIIKTMQLKAGDKVSYNGTFTAPRAMRIGVLPLGYYEGIPRELSNIGVVTSNTRVLPIVGRICMNHTMIDLKDTQLQTGDEVTVFDADFTQPNAIAAVCTAHHLFPYVVLVKLSSSIRRRII